MSSGTNVHGTSVEHVLSSALKPATAAVYVVGPTPLVVESLVELSVDSPERPPVRILADEPVLKDVFDDFPIATDAADLIASGALELRVPGRATGNTLVVTDESVVAVVTAGDHVAGLQTDDPSFVRSARETYGDRFASGEEFTLSNPRDLISA